MGYAKKSRSEKNKDAVEQSLNLQSYKLKKKLLCGEVYHSYSNASQKIEQRDTSSDDLNVDTDGDTQGTSIRSLLHKIGYISLEYNF